MPVDPVGHRPVMVLRNEDGQRERAQQPLRCPLPVRLLLADRDQLTGERKGVLVEVQFPAERRAQVKLASGNVALALAQAEQCFGSTLKRITVEDLVRTASLQLLASYKATCA